MKAWILIGSLVFQAVFSARALAEPISGNELRLLGQLFEQSMRFNRDCFSALEKDKSVARGRLGRRLELLFKYGFIRAGRAVTPANAAEIAAVLNQLRGILLTSITGKPDYYSAAYRERLGDDENDFKNLYDRCGDGVKDLLNLTAAWKVVEQLAPDNFPDVLPEDGSLVQAMVGDPLLTCQPINLPIMTGKQLETTLRAGLWAMLGVGITHALSAIAATIDACAAACGMLIILPNGKPYWVKPSLRSLKYDIACEVVDKNQVACDIPNLGSVDFACSRG